MVTQVKKPKVLVVDDEPMITNMLYEALNKKNYTVAVTDTGTKALDMIDREHYDLIITDVYLPDLNGMEILKTAKKTEPNVGVIVITGHGSVESAVEAIKEGAYDYLTKGFSLDEIELTVEKFFQYQRLVKENQQLRTELGNRFGIRNIVGNSAKIKNIFDTVETVAPTNATVLIQGASGTGKELIAKAMHQCSTRADQPFIKTNCAAIPDGLVESELFGHVKGAFTGAIRSTKGRFELADGGTLLLDEIGEVNPMLQAKLLRVLQEKEIEKVGDPSPIKVDVRIIATTNRDLKKEVEHGNFRKDLFYRLNVVPIVLPTLKERMEDIPLLVEHFVEKYAQENNRQIKSVEDEVIDLLMKHDWPGNVRELENTLERAVVLCREQSIQKRHIYFENDNSNEVENNLPDGMTLRELEKTYILQALQKCDGNRTKTASELGISRRTLRNKISEYQKEGAAITVPQNNEVGK